MDQISITNLYICLFHVYSGAYLNARFKAHNLASVGYAANRLIPTLLIFSLMSSAGNAAMESVDLRIVPANEILSKIKIGGDVNYDDVIINDDINTSQIKGVIHSSIRITNSEILGNIDFSNAKIKDIFDFDGTDFSGDFNFEKQNSRGKLAFKLLSFTKILPLERQNSTNLQIFWQLISMELPISLKHSFQEMKRFLKDRSSKGKPLFIWQSLTLYLQLLRTPNFLNQLHFFLLSLAEIHTLPCQYLWS
jgi:hypothetical protein